MAKSFETKTKSSNSNTKQTQVPFFNYGKTDSESYFFQPTNKINRKSENETKGNLFEQDKLLTKEGDDKSKLPSYGEDDALHGLKLSEKLKFYQRLAALTLAIDPNSLAGMLLKRWASGAKGLFVIPNDKIKNHPKVKEQLVQYRDVFLSKKSTSRGKIGGVVPRLQNKTWDGVSPLKLNYQGSSFDIVSLTDFVALRFKKKMGMEFSDKDKIESDLFTSLHTTSLVTDAIVSGKIVGKNKITVAFDSFESYIKDNYNWDKNEGLTLMNPDYGNKFKVENPVRENSQSVKIYHNHAIELEENGMAHSFDFVSEKWSNTVKGEDVSF